MTEIPSKKKKEIFSPILFSTTIRNPERCKYLIKIINKYDGQYLDDRIAIKIMTDCIQKKIYSSQKAFSQIDNYKELYNSNDEIPLSMAKTIVNQVTQNHKQRGFEKGWSSRFKTVFEICRLFGFVWFSEPEFKKTRINITNLGKELSDCCELQDIPKPWETDTISDREQSIFLHALAKYQVNNPFKRVLNKVNPLSLLLQTIKLLNDDKEISGAGISKKELAILVFWKDNNANKLYEKIKSIRSIHSFNPSDEVILQICDSLSGDIRQKSRLDHSILVEYPDDFNRKLTITGLISRRGEGRFFDINKKRIDLADYIIENYSKVHDYKSEEEYFKFVSSEDKFLLDYKTKLPETISLKEIEKWSLKLGDDVIKNELMLLKNRSSSNHEICKNITGYIRLEWLIALIIKNKCKNFEIKPNLKTDDEGLPYFQAPPKKFDIEAESETDYVFIEVSLISNAEQVPREINKIPRKIKDHVFQNEKKNKRTFFIAPIIHEDSENMAQWLKDKKNITIVNFDIEDFINKLEISKNLSFN